MNDAASGSLYQMIVILVITLAILGVMLLFITTEDPHAEELQEQAKWCAEYHPNLTASECSDDAGW